MAIAVDQVTPYKPLSLDEFLTRYGGDNRYELIDGEVFDLGPTGPHEEVAAFITAKLCVQIDTIDLPWFVLCPPYVGEACPEGLGGLAGGYR